MSQNRFRIPSLSALRSFEAAARHESFTHAADELNVSQGAISRKIKELEHMLGMDLFRRVGRSVKLTKAGYVFASEIERDLSSLSSTIGRAMSVAKGERTIRLAVLPTFGNRWLVPRLSQFFELHPEIRLSIATRDRPFNLAQQGFDLAIHFGDQDWPDTDVTPLCYETLLPVASPGFQTKHPIASASDLGSGLIKLAP